MKKITQVDAINIAIAGLSTLDSIEDYSFNDIGDAIAKLQDLKISIMKKAEKNKSRSQAKKVEKTDAKNEAILALAPNNMSCKEIAEALGVAFQAISKNLTTMVDSGLLTVEVIKGKKYFTIVKANNENA